MYECNQRLCLIGPESPEIKKQYTQGNSPHLLVQVELWGNILFIDYRVAISPQTEWHTFIILEFPWFRSLNMVQLRNLQGYNEDGGQSCNLISKLGSERSISCIMWFMQKLRSLPVGIQSSTCCCLLDKGFLYFLTVQLSSNLLH